jgi:uncharacterized protein
VARTAFRRVCGFLSLCLLGCLTAAHAASPVWAIRGEHNTVYLAGSVHLLQAADAALPAAFDRAYRGSGQLVMELAMDKIDPMQAAGWMMEHGMLQEGTTLHSILGEERYRRVTAEANRLSLPMEALEQFEPWVVGLELLEMQYTQLGFDPQQGVEQQLQSRAQHDGKSIGGLETLDEQLGVLQHMSRPEQLRFLDMVVSEMHDVASETRTVISAWKSGDNARLAALLGDEYKSNPALYRVLVSDRNRRWIPQIERLLHERDDCFVVVGALHLVGENGLLELLSHDGYKPENLN